MKWLKSMLDSLVFFSSRRRHTRYWRDWSSDVCSSDLGPAAAGSAGRRAHGHRRPRRDPLCAGAAARRDRRRHGAGAWEENGRESCRGRVEISVVVAILKKKKTYAWYGHLKTLGNTLLW